MAEANAAKPGLLVQAGSVLRWLKLPTARRRARWRASRQFQRLVASLGPADIVIDAGANLGTVTAALSATGASVHAFEPDPYCVDLLRARFAGQGNVRLYPCAIGTTTGQVTLYRHQAFASDPVRRSQGSSVFVGKRDMEQTGIGKVDQVDIIDVLHGLPGRVRLMKLDVEGAEVPILERLLDTGAIDRIDWLFTETHERLIPELRQRTERLRQRLADGGYRQVNLHWH